ncbi:MAG: hypothetical protein IJ759_07960 [Bacteroidales bacterium]|nr:hypothetical protein [Bacteroidales bacterium]
MNLRTLQKAKQLEEEIKWRKCFLADGVISLCSRNTLYKRINISEIDTIDKSLEVLVAEIRRVIQMQLIQLSKELEEL